jgi:hypothetical protein
MFAIMPAAMRALGTQVRLRRLLRAYVEYLARLAAAPADRRLAAASRGRLLEMFQGLRQAWAAESAESLRGPERVVLRRHVSRGLSAIEAELARLGAPMTDPERRLADFEAAALPLVFFLRGLEELPEREVLEWLRPRALERSA